jgi:hypothetical protein
MSTDWPTTGDGERPKKGPISTGNSTWLALPPDKGSLSIQNAFALLILMFFSGPIYAPEPPLIERAPNC